MKKLIFVLVILIATVQVTNATDVGGNVQGIWSPANNPYNVISEIHVPAGSTLVIQPGVVVNFMGHYKFNVDEGASMYAVGTETDSIYFTCDTLVNPDRWHGIRLWYPDSTTQISYCHIEYGKAVGEGFDIRGGGIYVRIGNGCIISHCTITNNSASGFGGGVYLEGLYTYGVVLCHNVISRNEGQGAVFHEYYVFSYNNLICNNYGTGVISNRGYGYMINNTIVNNDPDGVHYGNYGPDIANCIIWGNSGTDFYGSSTEMVYTDVGTWPYPGEGNLSADPLFRDSANGDFHLQDSINCGDVYYSPCIDRGDTSRFDGYLHCDYGLGELRSDMGAYGNKGLTDYCVSCSTIVYTPRVPNEGGIIVWDLNVFNCGTDIIDVFGEIYPTIGDCAGTQYDFNIRRNIVNSLATGYSFIDYYYYNPGTVIGVSDVALYISIGSAYEDYIANCCFEFKFTYPWGRPGNEIVFGPGEWGVRGSDEALPSTTSLSQNYPNPFNAKTSISFDLAQEGDVNLSVYNLMGQRIETLVDGRMHAGQHNIVWDASTYSSGIYFYKLSTGESIVSKRMVLLK